MDIVSATVPSRFLGVQLLERGKENMMKSLYDYAVDTGTLKSKKAKYIELHEQGDEVTVLYKIDGQKYINDRPSARTMPKSVAKDRIKVDDNGYLIGGTVVKKQNFWVWSPSEDDCEA